MFEPKHTFESVVRELVVGLESGTLRLPHEPAVAADVGSSPNPLSADKRTITVTLTIPDSVDAAAALDVLQTALRSRGIGVEVVPAANSNGAGNGRGDGAHT